MAQFAVYYRKNNTDCCTYVTMDYPSESMAMAILLRQGTIKSSDNVYIRDSQEILKFFQQIDC